MCVPRFSLLVAVLVAGLSLGCGDQSSKDGFNSVRVGAVLGTTPGQDDYAYAEIAREFEFPSDHGAHDEFRSEWWYFTSVLVDVDSDREFGVQWTLFRQALSPAALGDGPWMTGQAYMAHMAVTDVSAGRHMHAQRFARGHPELAGASAEPLGLWIEDWRVEAGALEPLMLELRAADEDRFRLELDFEQTRPIVAQGEGGLSSKGPGQASYYYSIPRLRTTGRVGMGGRTFAVQGWTWFDREWSTSVLGDDLVGWDWFALQLDDKRDMMAFRLRRRDGQRDPFDYLMVRDADRIRRLGPADFELVPRGQWRDSHGVEWPLTWQLTVLEAGGRETFDVAALVDDQVMEVGFRYWEGIVGVTRDGRRLGRGYMELTGYGNDSGEERTLE
jgi:predicted secreted hydrolase